MTHDTTQARRPQSPVSGHEHHGGHRGHGWMMTACCIPMLAVAVVLVATGVAGAGFLFVAVICTVMMAMMTGGMGHGDGNQRGR